MYVTISCLDSHPRKFIREKLQDDQTSKILYIKNFPVLSHPGTLLFYCYHCTCYVLAIKSPKQLHAHQKTMKEYVWSLSLSIANISSGFSTRSISRYAILMYTVDNLFYHVPAVLQDTHYTVRSYNIMIFGALRRCDLGRESQLLAKCDIIQQCWCISTKKNLGKIYICCGALY